MKQNETEFRFEGKTLAFLEQQYLQLAALQQGINGALSLILNQNSLEGQWSIDWPNRRMVRMDARAPDSAPALAAAEVREDEHATNNGRR